MTAFRVYLILTLSVLLLYTGVTMAHYGANFLTPYFSDLVTFRWAGQFNLDFGLYLLHSGLWVAWRNGFTIKAFILAALAFTFGMIFLAIYLLILSRWTGGDMQAVMLGVHAPDGNPIPS